MLKKFEFQGRKIQVIPQFCILSRLSLEGKVFLKILANHLTEYLLRNLYIDTAVQREGVTGIIGCIEHIGVAIQLIKRKERTKESWQSFG